MATNAVSGQGTTLVIGIAQTTVGEIRSISGPTMARDQIDVTHLGTDGGYRDFILGFADPGEVTFTMNYEDTTYDALKTAFDALTAEPFRINIAGGAKTLTFNALVASIPLNIDPGDAITVDVTLKITGEVELIG